MRLILLFLLLSFNAFSQNFYWVRGYVFTAENEPLVGVNVVDFNTKLGTQTNSKGQYELKLAQGFHRITYSYLGFESINYEIALNMDESHNEFMKPDSRILDEVEIKVRKRDFSYEVIKNVIEQKEKLQKRYINYSCKTYIKASDESASKIEKKNRKNQIDTISINDTIPKTTINFFEASIIRYFEFPDKTKEERTAVKKIGIQKDMYFTTTSSGEFDLYKNVQQVLEIGDNSYVSPISTIGLLSYKFKLLESFYENGKLAYRIELNPRELGNALYEGEIEVWDGEWVLKKVNLKLPRKTLINYDEFEIEQEFKNFDGNWMLSKAVYNWKIKQKGEPKIGKTTVEQKDFEFDKDYPKKFFGNELGITTKEAYKKDSTFWEAIRPEPLSLVERNLIINKDKLDAKQNSKEYLDSLDAVTNKITFLRVSWIGVSHINREKKTNWFFDPLATIIAPISIGGPRVRYGIRYSKRYENRQSISFSPNLSYGLNNHDIQGRFRVNYFYNPIKVSSITFSGGRYFDVINGNATIGDIIRRNNFFIRDYGNIGHRTELFNGFYLNTSVNYSRRSDLSNIKFTKFGDDLFNNNVATVFEQNNSFQTGIVISYTPNQRYLIEPNQKVILGSKYPTFSFLFDKAWSGNNVANTKFSKIEFTVNQTFNTGIFGISEYRFATGKFLDTTRLSSMDYKYQRGGDKWFFFPSMYAFQLIPKTFTTLNWYFEGHYEHQFNGFIASKVPLFNKTGIRTVAGGGLLYVPERNYQYSEVYFGINRIFKVGRTKFRLGAYSVSAQSNKFGLRTGIKFSFEPYDDFNNSWSF